MTAAGSTVVRAHPTLANPMGVPPAAVGGCGGAGADGGAHVERGGGEDVAGDEAGRESGLRGSRLWAREANRTRSTAAGTNTARSWQPQEPPRAHGGRPPPHPAFSLGICTVGWERKVCFLPGPTPASLSITASVLVQESSACV